MSLEKILGNYAYFNIIYLNYNDEIATEDCYYYTAMYLKAFNLLENKSRNKVFSFY